MVAPRFHVGGRNRTSDRQWRAGSPSEGRTASVAVRRRRMGVRSQCSGAKPWFDSTRANQKEPSEIQALFVFRQHHESLELPAAQMPPTLNEHELGWTKRVPTDTLVK